MLTLSSLTLPRARADSAWRFPIERFVDDAATAASLRRDEKRALAWYSEFQQAGRPRAGPRLSLRRSDAAALASGEPLDSSGAPPAPALPRVPALRCCRRACTRTVPPPECRGGDMGRCFVCLENGFKAAFCSLRHFWQALRSS
jgi:hypothetical protein